MIGIEVNGGGFKEAFGRVLSQARNPEAVLKVCGRELANLLKKHFREKDRSNVNKLAPGRREHFWLQVSRSVNAPVVSGSRSVSVRVSDPRIAQKVFGGEIRAKRAAALTIPVAEEAYGRTVSTFERETGMRVFRVGAKGAEGAKGALAVKVGEQIKVVYALRKRVMQQKDPTALPEMGKLEAAILARARSVIGNS